MPYTQSKQYLRTYQKYKQQTGKTNEVEAKLLEHVLKTTPKGDPQAVIQATNKFCEENWMMNLGEEKGQIVIDQLAQVNPKSILELGGYCGFSALLMAANSNAQVHTIEPNQYVASIAHRIHQHAGLDARITIHIGTLQSLGEFVQNHGKFDLVFIDHVKHLYLPDFKELERLGAISLGTVVVGDNIIYPGSPDYLQHLQLSPDYDSILFHSYVEYSNIPDAVLVSRRINS